MCGMVFSASDEDPEADSKTELITDCWDQSRGVVNQYSSAVAYWDTLLLSILVWTAVVTPFEVSFLEPSYNHMFVLNRLIDICFIGDIVLTFCLDPIGPNKESFETDGKPDLAKIRDSYLQGSMKLVHLYAA